jgi:hypothetical protein
MKWTLVAACAAALSLASIGSADAKGCIKGAIVGGVAGHMAGHGKLGAAAGCAIGHHEANKPDPNNANARAPDKKWSADRDRSLAMKIRSHSESHVVELEDSSRWQIFPGDVDVTLDWRPETDLTLLPVEDEVCSHILVSESGPVRVIRAGKPWPASQVKSILKDG